MEWEEDFDIVDEDNQGEKQQGKKQQIEDKNTEKKNGYEDIEQSDDENYVEQKQSGKQANRNEFEQHEAKKNNSHDLKQDSENEKEEEEEGENENEYEEEYEQEFDQNNDEDLQLSEANLTQQQSNNLGVSQNEHNTQNAFRNKTPNKINSGSQLEQKILGQTTAQKKANSREVSAGNTRSSNQKEKPQATQIRNKLPPTQNNKARSTSRTQTNQTGIFKILKMKELEELLGEKDYSNASNKDLKLEHNALRDKLKELNSKLTEKVESIQLLLQKQATQEKKQKVRSDSNQSRSFDADTENNNKIIKRLTEEFQKLEQRQSMVSDPSYNNNLKQQIEASKALVIKLKAQTKTVNLKNDQQCNQKIFYRIAKQFNVAKELSKASSAEGSQDALKEAQGLRNDVQAALLKVQEIEKKKIDMEDLYSRKIELLEAKDVEIKKKMEEAKGVGASSNLDPKGAKKKMKWAELKNSMTNLEKANATIIKMSKTKEGIQGREIEEMLKELDERDKQITKIEDDIGAFQQKISERILLIDESQRDIFKQLQTEIHDTTQYSIDSAASKPNMNLIRMRSEDRTQKRRSSERNKTPEKENKDKDKGNNTGVNFFQKKKEDAVEEQVSLAKPFSVRKSINQKVWKLEEPQSEQSNQKQPEPQVENKVKSPSPKESQPSLKPFSIKKGEILTTPSTKERLDLNFNEESTKNISKENLNSQNNQEEQNASNPPQRMFKFKRNGENSNSSYNPLESIGQQGNIQPIQGVKQKEEEDNNEIGGNSRITRIKRKGDTSLIEEEKKNEFKYDINSASNNNGNGDHILNFQNAQKSKEEASIKSEQKNHEIKGNVMENNESGVSRKRGNNANINLESENINQANIIFPPIQNPKNQPILDSALADDEFSSLNNVSRRNRPAANGNNKDNLQSVNEQPTTFNFKKNIISSSPKESTEKKIVHQPQQEENLFLLKEQPNIQKVEQNQQKPPLTHQDADEYKFLGPQDRRKGKKGLAVENTGAKVGKRDIFGGNDEEDFSKQEFQIKELGDQNKAPEQHFQEKINVRNSQIKKSALEEENNSGLDFLKQGKPKINYNDDDDAMFQIKKQTNQQDSKAKKQDDKSVKEKQLIIKAQKEDFFDDLF